MEYFTSESSPCCKVCGNGEVSFENEYIKWIHDEKSGQLTGAVVKNGSGANMIASPLYFSINSDNGGGVKCFKAGFSASKVEFCEKGVVAESEFVADDGSVLPGLLLRHTIEYGEWGEGVHTLEVLPEQPVTGIRSMMPVRFGVTKSIDRVGIRRRLASGVGAWSQNPMHWQELHGGKRASDTLPFLECQLPLSMIFLDAGTEALQLEMSDDVAAWEIVPGYQENAMLWNKADQAYDVRWSTLCDRRGDVLDKPFKLKFRLTLPFVRKNIVPLRRVSSVIYFNRPFEERWPTEEDLANMKKAGIDLLRLHCDGDSFKNGIYWRATIYPPFPAEEMKKMDAFIDAAHRYGIHVVPYFSVKEFHFDSPDYKENFEKWGRRGWQTAPIRTNGTFGAVMCLASDWKNKRRSSILEVMNNHAFDGIYYDWCAGLECDNREHGTAAHWDNDQLLEHLRWTAEQFKERPERYLHTTFVASLAVENAATMVITEEQGFPEPGPQMFTPHVHFLNVAPRQICSMIRNATPVQDRQVAMAALLHHATVSSSAPQFLEFYAGLDWIDEVTKYTAHTAPGEGLAVSSNEEVGVSVYWNDDEALIVCANFSEERASSEITVDLPEKPGIEETVELAGLEVKVIRCKLLVDEC